MGWNASGVLGPHPSTSGPLSAMPASGTGSGRFYYAFDDADGTLYQDRTDGEAYSVCHPRGLIAKAESGTTQTVTSVLSGAAPDYAGWVALPGLTASFDHDGEYQLLVTIDCPYVSNNTADKVTYTRVTETEQALGSVGRIGVSYNTSAAKGNPIVFAQPVLWVAGPYTLTVEACVSAASTATFSVLFGPMRLQVVQF